MWEAGDFEGITWFSNEKSSMFPVLFKVSLYLRLASSCSTFGNIQLGNHTTGNGGGPEGGGGSGNLSKPNAPLSQEQSSTSPSPSFTR